MRVHLVLGWIRFTWLSWPGLARPVWLPLVAATDVRRPKFISSNSGPVLGLGLNLSATFSESSSLSLLSMTLENPDTLFKESLRWYTIIAAAAKYLYWVGLIRVAKAKRPTLGISNLSHCKVSIQGQMKHVKLGLVEPDITEVFNPKCPSWSHKSMQAFILSLSLQTDNIVAEYVSSFHLSYWHRQLCCRNLANLVS